MKKLSFLLLLTFAFINAFAQQDTEPAFCKNPPAGIQVGGSFLVNPGIGCLDFANNSGTISVSNSFSPTGGALSNLGYIFDFKDGDKVILPPVLQTSYTVNKGGIYWILQAGNEKGTQYIACRSVEIIQTEQPDFTVTSSGNKTTVTFLNTPKNKKYGKYRITWGDGTQDFSAQITILPFLIQHSYSFTPTKSPQIVALYTRGLSNSTACLSSPISFPVIVSGKPRISELEGLNGGKNAKITLSEGLNDIIYSIQQKTKEGNWVDTGKKITRKSTTNSSQEIIDVLNPTDISCFRLQGTDENNKDIFSNEVCTIKPTATIISDKEVKLDWSIPDSNLIQYEITYRDCLTGIYGKLISPKTNKYNFDSLDFSKKYWVKVNANISTKLYGEIIVKTHEFNISTNAVKELPASDELCITTVLPDTKRLRYNIFESSGVAKPKYHFFRSINGGNFEKVSESFDNFYEDKDVDLEKNQYCYAYKYENECGVLSALSINKPCNIKLSLENTTLKWTPFLLDNSANKAEYFVDFFDDITLKFQEKVAQTSYDFLTSVNFNPLKTPKFRVLGIIKYPININGLLTPFNFAVYSNTVTYTPPLSTSSESEILNIYPNPSEGIIQFNSIFQLKTAEIVDLQGKIVENQAIEENQVSVKNLPKGKYILRLYNQEKKLVINKTIVKM